MASNLTSETTLRCLDQAELPGPAIAFLVTRSVILKGFFPQSNCFGPVFLKQRTCRLHRGQLQAVATLCVCAGALKLCALVNALFRDSFSLVLFLLLFPELKLVSELQKKNLVPVQSCDKS